MLLLPAAVMLLVLLKFSAGLGLYWGTSTAVAVVQSLLVRRAARPGSVRQR